MILTKQLQKMQLFGEDLQCYFRAIFSYKQSAKVSKLEAS